MVTVTGIARSSSAHQAAPGRQIAIDRVRCDGHGLCAALLPGRFSLDEWGYPVVSRTDVPDAELAEVRRTVAACPALALYLTTDRHR